MQKCIQVSALVEQNKIEDQNDNLKVYSRAYIDIWIRILAIDSKKQEKDRCSRDGLLKKECVKYITEHILNGTMRLEE